MKAGDAVEMCDEAGESIAGTIIEIVVRIEDEEGEIWEVPVEEAHIPELEETQDDQSEE